MRYPLPLIQGRLLRRYKRFLVDVRLEDGTEVVAHCPNTGSMLEINRAGARCLLLPNDAPHRRLRFTLEAVRLGRIWVGAHPLRANTVGREAIEAGLVRGVAGVIGVRAEVPYGRASRADLVLQVRRGKPWTVEIKSASLGAGRVARFPDSVTDRGLKHLEELLGVVQQGGRALMLFVATRDDVDVFRPAWGIDIRYARRLREVSELGVVVRAVTSRITKTSMNAVRALPIDLRAP